MEIHRLASKIKTCFVAASLSLCACAITLRSHAASNWPQFRGPNCSGTSADAKPPVEIGPDKGAKWSIEVTPSPSSPCVWGDRIFLTTYDAGELQTRCYSASTGKLLWTRGIKPDRLEAFHSSEGSPAAATPATDGHRVVAYFGSAGLVCYDTAGKELWRHPLPVAQSGGSFGSGTSPIIAGDRVLLNRDQDENSSLMAMDLKTGKTVWETPRPEAHGSFGTPIIWKNRDAEEVVTPGSIRIKGYELKSGKERWMVEGVAAFCCTTPAVGDGMLFFAAFSPGKSDMDWSTWDKFLDKFDTDKDGVVDLKEIAPNMRDYFRGMDVNHDGRITKDDFDQFMASLSKGQNVMVAVRPGGHGDISQTHVAWKVTKGLPYVPSPLFYDGRVYIIRDGGMMSSFDASSGKPFYAQERLEAADQYYASPVAADGRIYVVSVPGKLTVVKAGGERPEILHQADFHERIVATPALVGPDLYLRTKTKLYVFSNGVKQATP